MEITCASEYALGAYKNPKINTIGFAPADECLVIPDYSQDIRE
jgi:hypothetical protein